MHGLWKIDKKGYGMGSESKEVRLGQKEYWETQLDRRISELTERGVAPTVMPKDAAVRKMRAEIRKAVSRLQVIEAKEKKIADMAKAKKSADSKGKKQKAKKGGDKSPEMSKRQQKKKAKKAKKETEKTKEE